MFQPQALASGELDMLSLGFPCGRKGLAAGGSAHQRRINRPVCTLWRDCQHWTPIANPVMNPR